MPKKVSLYQRKRQPSNELLKPSADSKQGSELQEAHRKRNNTNDIDEFLNEMRMKKASKGESVGPKDSLTYHKRNALRKDSNGRYWQSKYLSKLDCFGHFQSIANSIDIDIDAALAPEEGKKSIPLDFKRDSVVQEDQFNSSRLLETVEEELPKPKKSYDNRRIRESFSIGEPVTTNGGFKSVIG